MYPLITIVPTDRNLSRYANMLGAIGQGRAHAALARAVNRTVDMVFTRTVRSLVKQTSAPRKMVVASLRKRKANPGGGGVIEGAVMASGRPLSLKYFRPREIRSGTEVTVMGAKQYIEGAFFKSGWTSKFARSNNGGLGHVSVTRRVVLGGHVYKRTSTARTPIEKLFGPSIPEAMVNGATAEVFQKEAPAILDRRVAHELGRMLGDL